MTVYVLRHPLHDTPYAVDRPEVPQALLDAGWYVDTPKPQTEPDARPDAAPESSPGRATRTGRHYHEEKP